MADLIKSPLTERAELQLAGIDEDMIFYTVLDQSSSDGLPGRDRKISLKNIERYLLGFANNRTVAEMKYGDEFYIVGDETLNKVRTKVTLDSFTRFITGENNGDYVFNNEDTIIISKKPASVGVVGDRLLTSILSLKEEIRETVRHWKTITVGWDGTNLANRFNVDENGNITAIGATSGNTAFSFDYVNGTKTNKLQIGWNSSNLANRFNVDENGNITVIGAASGNASFTHSFADGSKFNKLQVGWATNALANNFSVDENGNIIGLSLTSLNATRFSIADTGLARFRTLQVGHDGSNFQPYFSVTVDGDATIRSITSTTNQMFLLDNTGKITGRSLQIGGTTEFVNNFSVTTAGVCTAVQFVGPLNGNATSADKVNQALSLGTYLSYNTGTTFDGSAARTINTNATSANTGSTLVARDVNGDFSARIITATTFSGTLSGNATTATTADKVGHSLTPGLYLTGSAFDGSAAITFAVDATSANTASKVVARDSSGNFSAGTITATLSGNATTATRLQTARTINGVAFDGSANITIAGTTDYSLTAGSYLTGGSFNGSAAKTFAVDATSANTASKVVARDSSGNFSAGTITATLSGNATTATRLQTARTINGVAFDGTGNITISAAPTAHTHTELWSQSHPASYYIMVNWDGTYWNTTSNHGSPVRVGYADNAGYAGSAGSAGNATSANKVNNALTINGTPYDGSSAVSLNIVTSISTLTAGNYLNGGIFNGTAPVTFAVNATSANTGNAVVARDANGNFSASTIESYGQVIDRGITWTLRKSSIGVLANICYGNGLFVAVGNNILLTSPDGINWTQRTTNNDNWKFVCYGNGLFVAISATSCITSSDGITWTSRTIPAGNGEYNSVCYGNGLFVILSYSDGIILTSPDGINWTQRTTNSSNTYNSICYGNGLFVILPSSGIGYPLTSPDGITWTLRNQININTTSICYGNGTFVVVGNNGTSGAKVSSNCETWTQSTTIDGNWKFVCYGNGIFVAVGLNAIMTSPDGITWTSRTGAYNELNAVCYGNGIFVAVGGNGNIITSGKTLSNIVNHNNIYQGEMILRDTLKSEGNIIALNGVYTRGVKWDQITVTDYGWSTICYGNGMFVAVGGDQNNDLKIMTSEDGRKWIIRTTLSGTRPYGYKICYGNGIFIILMKGNGSYYTNHLISSDGITWTWVNNSFNSYTNNVCYGNGIFVSVSESGSGIYPIYTSPDGVTWTPRADTSGNYAYSSICYGNGIFVASSSGGGGYGNHIGASSDNGVTWIRSSDDSSHLPVCYGNGLFVTAKYGNIITSPDGVTWTSRTSPFLASFIYFVDGLFIAGDSAGTSTMISKDGITWTNSTNYFNTKYPLCIGNGILVGILSNTIFVVSGNKYNNNIRHNNTYQGGMSIYGTLKSDKLQIGLNGDSFNSKFTVNENGNISAVGAVSGNAAFTFDYTNGTKLNKLQVGWSASALANNFSVDENGIVEVPGQIIDRGIIWTNRTVTYSMGSWYSTCYGNGLFVIVGNNTTNGVLTSQDLITWTPRTTINGTFLSVCYNNSLFVAVGGNGIITSPDGITWTQRNSSFNALGSVCYGNGMFVIVGNNTTNGVLTSPDGITWTQRTCISGNWRSITYGNGLFVAINSGTGSALMTSPDGITWTQRTCISGDWRSITYGNGLFVVVGLNAIMTSPDGITWTSRTGATGEMGAVCYGNGIFVSFGLNVPAITSINGITWVQRTVTNGDWRSITYGNGMFVAISVNWDTNKVLTSGKFLSNTTVNYGGKTFYGLVNIVDSLVVGNPTGGDKGAGTINAVAVYDDNVLLTKYVLDYFINKDFVVDNYLVEKKAVDRFLQFADTTCKNLDTYNEYVMNNRVLPSFADIETSKEIPSVGTLSQRCWEELEIKTIHIMNIHDREKELELQVQKLENRVRDLENAQIG